MTETLTLLSATGGVTIFSQVLFTLMEHLMISISGACCSGKTSASGLVHKEVPHSIIIHQDDYYLEETDAPIVDGYSVWDDEGSFDWSKLLSTVECTLKNPAMFCHRCSTDAIGQDINTQHTIILEGIQILTNKYIITRSNLSYFIVLDEENCLKRRRLRTDYVDVDHEYFHRFVWPSYVRVRDATLKLDSVKILDGLLTIQEIYQKILTDLKNMVT